MALRSATLTRLYDEHAEALYAFLLSFTGQEADARDLLQEVFVKLAIRPTVLDHARNERAVLLQTCYRLGIDWTRRREVRRRHEDGFATLPGGAVFAPANNPDARTFRAALGGATRTTCGPVRRRDPQLWQGLTFQEIADAADTSLHTAAPVRRGEFLRFL